MMTAYATSTYLEDLRLIVLAQVVRKHICVHERPSALAEDVHSLSEKLHLDPRHVVLLHLLHFILQKQDITIKYL